MKKVVFALLLILTGALTTPKASAGMVRTVYDAQGNAHIIGAYDPTPAGFTGPDPWPVPSAPPQAGATSNAPPKSEPQPTGGFAGWVNRKYNNIKDNYNSFKNNENRIDRAAAYNAAQYGEQVQDVNYNGQPIFRGVDPLTQQQRYFTRDANGGMTELSQGSDPNTGKLTFGLANPQQPSIVSPSTNRPSLPYYGENVPAGKVGKTRDPQGYFRDDQGRTIEKMQDGTFRVVNPTSTASVPTGGTQASTTGAPSSGAAASQPPKGVTNPQLFSTLSPHQQQQIAGANEADRQRMTEIQAQLNASGGSAGSADVKAMEQALILKETSDLRAQIENVRSDPSIKPEEVEARVNGAKADYYNKLEEIAKNPPESRQQAAKEILAAEKLRDERDIATAKKQYAGLDRNRYSRDKGRKAGPCGTSVGIDKEYKCDETESQIEMGQLGDAMGQVAGSAATQVVGQQQQIKAQGSGSQADALEGAATTSQTAGMAQGAKGMMNMTFGAMNMMNASKHKKNAEEIGKAKGAALIGDAGETGTGNSPDLLKQGAVSSEDKVAKKIITNWTMNEDSQALMECANMHSSVKAQCIQAREAQHVQKKSSIQGEVGGISDEGVAEQEAMAKKAKGAGIMSLMKGVADAIQAAGNLMAAKEYKKAADKLRGAEGQGGIGGYAPPTFNFSPSGATGNQGGGGLGNFNTGSDQAAVAGEVLTDPKNDDLGQGFGNPSDDKLAGVGPTPSAFSPASPQGGGGGGGLGMGGGGSTGSTPQEQEQQAAMAQDGGSLGYSAGVYRGGGGGRAGGGGKDPDISGMMAAMMGKKEEGAKNSILDYGSRGPASMNDGLLSADTDLFKQVSKRYQQKNQIGAVGLN